MGLAVSIVDLYSVMSFEKGITGETGHGKDENSKLKSALEGVIVMDKPEVSWDQVAGRLGSFSA